MTKKTHSSIGASSMYRWSVCPGSVKLSEGIKAPTSFYAAEGTCAHQLAEACLKEGVEPDTYLYGEHEVEGHKITVTEEMVDGIKVYVDTIEADRGADDKLYIEARFDLSIVYPGLYGTNDAVLWLPEPRTLRVYDFKYGAGIPVEVKRNKQLMYYALGAYLKLQLPVNTVELVIVQPRCPHPDGAVRRDIMSAIDLLDFRADLAMTAAATTKKNAIFATGSHCRFCPAAGICPKLGDQANAAAAIVFQDVKALTTAENPKGIDYDKLAEALRAAPILEARAAAVRELAYAEAEAGHAIPGFKLVDKKATRQWRDEAATPGALVIAGVAKEHIYAEPKLRSPAQVEKAIGKKDFTKVAAELVHKVSSGHALAPDTDKRVAVVKQTAVDAFADA